MNTIMNYELEMELRAEGIMNLELLIFEQDYNRSTDANLRTLLDEANYVYANSDESPLNEASLYWALRELIGRSPRGMRVKSMSSNGIKHTTVGGFIEVLNYKYGINEVKQFDYLQFDIKDWVIVRYRCNNGKTYFKLTNRVRGGKSYLFEMDDDSFDCLEIYDMRIRTMYKNIEEYECRVRIDLLNDEVSIHELNHELICTLPDFDGSWETAKELISLI